MKIEVTTQELKELYMMIDFLYNADVTVPKQVFKHPVATFVYKMDEFLDGNLTDIIHLSRLKSAKHIWWLPNIEVPKNIPILKLDLKDSLANVGSLLEELWKESTLFQLLDYGCLFNENKNWIIHFSIELQVVMVGVFNQDINVESEISAKRYTKATFLSDFEEFPEDYENKRAGVNESKRINSLITYPFIENYFSKIEKINKKEKL
ncbi:hypothetical protein DZD26_13830 [Listeria monocytogenes]|nr:hypothetical protein [Listeria monocytogenes]